MRNIFTFVLLVIAVQAFGQIEKQTVRDKFPPNFPIESQRFRDLVDFSAQKIDSVLANQRFDAINQRIDDLPAIPSFKTINGQSITGAGNINIAGGGGSSFTADQVEAQIRQGNTATYYVSKTGNDGNPGSFFLPFATLEGARNAIRAYKTSVGGTLPKGKIEVMLRSGTYDRRTTFVLETQDSGTKDTQIIYRNYPGEKAIITGGIDIPFTDVEGVPAGAIYNRFDNSIRANIRQIDLGDLGISEADYGDIQFWQFGTSRNDTAVAGVYIDQIPFEMARYPNSGFTQLGTIIDVGSVPRYNPGAPDEPIIFEYLAQDAATIESWNLTNSEIWVYCYCNEIYANGILKIGSIDAGNNRITSVQPSWYGATAGRDYYFFNILEELDTVGEYYIDRNTDILYFYPPVGFGGSVSMSFGTELMVDMGANYVTFSGIDFHLVRNDAFSVTANNTTVENADIFGIGGTVWETADSTFHNHLSGNDIYRVGVPFTLRGGAKYTQQAGHSSVVNNYIHDFTRRSSVTGVNNRVAHNHAHGSAGDFVLARGQELMIEFNKIHDVDTTAADSGPIYFGRTPTDVGNVVRYNYIYNIPDPSGTGVQAIYIDDKSSFMHIYGNVVQDVGNAAIKINQGKYNLMENNLVIGTRGAFILEIDNWLLWVNQEVQLDDLAEANYLNPPFSIRYPIASSAPVSPEPGFETNIFRNNVILDIENDPNLGGGSNIVWGIYSSSYGPTQATIEGNYLIDYDPGFLSLEDNELRIDPAIWRTLFPGVKPIPYDAIGTLDGR